MAGGKAKISSKSKSHPQAGKGCSSFFYDSEEGTVFGRTAASWIKIIIFYIIFYTCLAGFFSLNYYLFSRTLNEDSPKWTLEESIIGTNPGVGFRPMPDQDANAESTLIWYQTQSESDAKFWYSQLEKVVNHAELPDGTPGVKKCSYETEGTTRTSVCQVDTKGLDRCSIDNKFGYRDGKPCVLIKLNKIFGWKPEPFGVVDGKYDPDQLDKDLEEKVTQDEMPEHLKSYILSQARKNPGNEANVLNTIWISCSGENVGDKENLPEGHISYFPSRGIPGYYFPFYNQKMYRSPFVMVHFDLPLSSRHVLVNVECRAWAKNIKYDRASRSGSVHFELMVD